MTEHHYEIRLERDLGDIKDRVSKIASLVGIALKQSLRALEHGDRQLAYRTILEDNPINREVEACDRACHYFVARHLPAAGHLRLISSVLRMNVVLERIGDYAATICRESTHLTESIKNPLASEIRLIGHESLTMFEQAVKAFLDESVDLARGTMVLEARIDESFDVAFGHLISTGEASEAPLDDLLGTLVILSMLERVSDQAKNICEYAIFAAEGETKKRKAVPVLFLDKANDVLGPIALAIGRKAYPDHGEYATAGVAPASEANNTCLDMLARLGHETADLMPKPVSAVDAWDDFKVIVCLDPETSEKIDPVPFNTVVVNWWELPRPDPSDEAGLEELYRVMSGYVSSLMTTLRGEDFG
jgi:phosphate transport system protein